MTENTFCNSDNIPESLIEVEIANEQDVLEIDPEQIQAAVRVALHHGNISEARMSVALVDDPTIHEINLRFLNHDTATDVISFSLGDDSDYLEGEIVISTDTAIREAPLAGWSAQEELLLYVVHGCLHLAGYDDIQDEDIREMRTAESQCLKKLGVIIPTQDVSE